MKLEQSDLEPPPVEDITAPVEDLTAAPAEDFTAAPAEDFTGAPVEDFTATTEQVPAQREAPDSPREEQPATPIPPKAASPVLREEGEVESLQELLEVEEGSIMRRSKGPVEAGGASRPLSGLKLRVLNPDDVRLVQRGEACFLGIVVEPGDQGSNFPLNAIVAGLIYF